MRYIITIMTLNIFLLTIPDCKAQVNIAGPENVLVVYNENDTTSEAIATYYKNTREIPTDNMLALDFPTSTDIDNHTVHLIHSREVIVDQDGNNAEDPDSIYNQTMKYVKMYITQPIEDYLNTTVINGDTLAKTIRYIVVCKGIPLKATSWLTDFSHHDDLSRRGVSVDALISIINQSNQAFSITNGSFISSSCSSPTYNNPYHAIEDDDGSEYNFDYRFITKTYKNTAGIELNYLVSRLDGYNYEDVITMIDKGADPDLSENQLLYWTVIQLHTPDLM